MLPCFCRWERKPLWQTYSFFFFFCSNFTIKASTCSSSWTLLLWRSGSGRCSVCTHRFPVNPLCFLRIPWSDRKQQPNDTGSRVKDHRYNSKLIITLGDILLTYPFFFCDCISNFFLMTSSPQWAKKQTAQWTRIILSLTRWTVSVASCVLVLVIYEATCFEFVLRNPWISNHRSTFVTSSVLWGGKQK